MATVEYANTWDEADWIGMMRVTETQSDLDKNSYSDPDYGDESDMGNDNSSDAEFCHT